MIGLTLSRAVSTVARHRVYSQLFDLQSGTISEMETQVVPRALERRSLISTAIWVRQLTKEERVYSFLTAPGTAHR